MNPYQIKAKVNITFGEEFPESVAMNQYSFYYGIAMSTRGLARIIACSVLDELREHIIAAGLRDAVEKLEEELDEMIAGNRKALGKIGDTALAKISELIPLEPDKYPDQNQDPTDVLQ